MPNATIDGKKPDSLPAKVKADINKGVPKRQAMSMSKPVIKTPVKVK